MDISIVRATGPGKPDVLSWKGYEVTILKARSNRFKIRKMWGKPEDPVIEKTRQAALKKACDYLRDIAAILS